MSCTLENMTKLEKLAEIEGFDDELDLLQEATGDSVCPGICTNRGCDYTNEVEPDQDQGYCEVCGTQTVKSALVLGGVI
jgi:hypothetical protein